jgi:hypothetical protein
MLAPGGSRTSGRTTSLPPAASTTGVRTPGSEAQSSLSSSSSPHPLSPFRQLKLVSGRRGPRWRQLAGLKLHAVAACLNAGELGVRCSAVARASQRRRFPSGWVDAGSERLYGGRHNAAVTPLCRRYACCKARGRLPDTKQRNIDIEGRLLGPTRELLTPPVIEHKRSSVSRPHFGSVAAPASLPRLPLQVFADPDQQSRLMSCGRRRAPWFVRAAVCVWPSAVRILAVVGFHLGRVL